MSFSGESDTESQECIDTVLDTASPPLSEEASIVAASGSATNLLAALLQKPLNEHSYSLSPSRLVSTSDPNLASASGYTHTNYEVEFPSLGYNQPTEYSRLVQESRELLEWYADRRSHVIGIEQRLEDISRRITVGALSPLVEPEASQEELLDSDSSEYLNLATEYQQDQPLDRFSPTPVVKQLVEYSDSEGSVLSNFEELLKPAEILHNNTTTNYTRSEESLTNLSNPELDDIVNPESDNQSVSSSNSILEQNQVVEDFNMANNGNQAIIDPDALRERERNIGAIILYLIPSTQRLCADTRPQEHAYQAI